MRVDSFRRFLTASYRGRDGKPLTAKAAFDAISRCRRIEQVLGVDLDDELERKDLESLLEVVRQRVDDFGFSGNPEYGVRSHRTACRTYAQFHKKNRPS